ncbi:histidine kinase [Nonomuraea sp. NPDC050691]|uniref:sensor histidine kinase n=1 Tax=Nonomuraea sp. NPDC050691 TaxID=3155661 RepID=UPI0033CA4D25
MVSEETHSGGRSRGRFARLSRLGTTRMGTARRSGGALARLGDVPVVVMLAWAGWLAVPWSFSGLAQARAAAAAAEAGLPPAPAATEAASPPTPRGTAAETAAPAALTGTPSPPAFAETASLVAPRGFAAPGKAWGLPATRLSPATVLRSAPSQEAVSAGVGPEAFAAERAWIAGEVHDAAGHGLAAIAMQAGVALVTLDDDPEQARVSLQAIRETSLTALAQLRAALDRLDPRPGAPATRAPYSTDSAHDADGGLGALVDGVRAAGLRVEVEPAGPAVPPHLQDAVYRVVRESLTNVLRHAGPSSTARVTLSGEPGAYVVEVVDHAAGTPEHRSEPGTGGRGLAGMRARVTALGGHLTAGPHQNGGFRVLARFPTETAIPTEPASARETAVARFPARTTGTVPGEDV